MHMYYFLLIIQEFREVIGVVMSFSSQEKYWSKESSVSVKILKCLSLRKFNAITSRASMSTSPEACFQNRKIIAVLYILVGA